MAHCPKGAAMTQSGEVAILTVTTTVGSMSDARTLARGIVEARLAACVQLDEIAASIYRWEGRVCEDVEARLTIKTVAGRLDALRAYFAEHHPYDVPQFVASAGSASAEYGEWVAGESS
jgi:periplasmic divalent cation tolerance protein